MINYVVELACGTAAGKGKRRKKQVFHPRQMWPQMSGDGMLPRILGSHTGWRGAGTKAVASRAEFGAPVSPHLIIYAGMVANFPLRSPGLAEGSAGAAFYSAPTRDRGSASACSLASPWHCAALLASEVTPCVVGCGDAPRSLGGRTGSTGIEACARGLARPPPGHFVFRKPHPHPLSATTAPPPSPPRPLSYCKTQRKE